MLQVTRKPSTSIGSLRPVRAPEVVPRRASASNDLASSRQRRKLKPETRERGWPASGLESQSAMSSSAIGYGSGRRRTASTRLKSATLLPMPSASVAAAAELPSGFRASCRRAAFRSWLRLMADLSLVFG